MESPSLLCLFIMLATLLLSLSFHHSPWLPVAVSLFISLCVTNLHHLPVSNFQFFPSLSLFTRCRSLSLSFFIHSHCLPQTLPSLPLSLCLCYFDWLTSVITRLPLVFCFVHVVSLGLLCAPVREWIHIHVSVLWKTLSSIYSLRPSGGTANLHIHECTHPHRHAFTATLLVTGCTILPLTLFKVLLITCFFCLSCP